MRRLCHLLTRLVTEKKGVAALEYGLIAAVLGGVVITASTRFGSSVSSAYSTIGSTLVTKSASM